MNKLFAVAALCTLLFTACKKDKEITPQSCELKDLIATVESTTGLKVTDKGQFKPHNTGFSTLPCEENQAIRSQKYTVHAGNSMGQEWWETKTAVGQYGYRMFYHKPSGTITVSKAFWLSESTKTIIYDVVFRI
jgi:hypothetical protein